MKLGEMLVRDGRLTEPQLEAALKYQARDGGRIGTVLFEHGLIDLEALTVYLGLELGIPIATGAMLERAKRAAVRLLQPAHAFKHKCVPLVVQDRQLIAAIEDPHDFATLEALTAITGYRVLPRVAPEVRIYYYIERYYGVARPPRFTKFSDKPRGDEGAVDQGLPAPPLPGLPPAPAAPVPAPGPRPKLRSVKMKMFDDSEALELEAEDLIDTLDADDAAPAEPAKAAAAPTRKGGTTIPPVVAPLTVAPMQGDVAMRTLATATDRTKIVEALLGFSAATFQAAVVFTVRDNMAFGWKAFGNLPGYANVEHLLIPLEAPSVVQSAIASDNGVFHGPLAPSTVNSYLYKVLGCTEPTVVTAGVIAIGKRVVNVLYGHGTELSPIQLGVLQQVCKSAADAYTRLIASKKK
ncbi:MAG: ral secretory system protein domain protein [Myxococcales bacterium]|nr:ral secretory system protein domain protein [Myxococcales bacterium]